MNGRDYTKLIYLNPGVAGSPDQISDSPGSFGTFSMNGSRGRANNFLLDGTDMNDGYRNDPAINEAGVFGDPATILPIDAVAELRVLSNYEAEYGRNSGAVVNIVTKSGTNTLARFGVGVLAAPVRLGGAQTSSTRREPQNPFHNNQFGGSLGGPIVKDHTFFYVDYEGQRESRERKQVRAASRFRSRLRTMCSERAGESRDYRFAGAQSLSEHRIFRGQLTTRLRRTISLRSIPDALQETTAFPRRSTTGSTALSGRSITTLIASNMLTGRYYFGDSDQSFPFAQLAGGVLPGFNTTTPTRVQLVSLSYVKVLNCNQVNEARLGWNRFAEGFFPEDQSFDPSSIGLNTGVTSPSISACRNLRGRFLADRRDQPVPRKRVDSNWHFIDNLFVEVGHA